MGRSLKKGPYVDEKLFIKVNKQVDSGSRDPIKTWASRCMVHNGKMFHKVFVTEDMVGHKLGEFSPTRTFKGHSSKKIK